MSSPRLSTTINPPDVPPPQPQFSQIATINLSGPTKLIAITGQLAIHMDPTDPPPRGFEDQVRMALANLENCLKAAGASKRHIFKVTHHVVGFNFEAQNPTSVFCDWMDSNEDSRGFRPASAMLPVTRLAGDAWLYEIETWAVVPL